MYFQIFDAIKKLDNYIINSYSFWMFRGYIAINKTGIEKIIDEIYATLPQDIKDAKDYLEKNNKNIRKNPDKVETIYDVLKELEITLEDSPVSIIDFSFVNKHKIHSLEEKLKNSIPEEIKEAENLKKY